MKYSGHKIKPFIGTHEEWLKILEDAYNSIPKSIDYREPKIPDSIKRYYEKTIKNKKKIDSND